MIANALTAFTLSGTRLISAITFGFVDLNLTLHFVYSYYIALPTPTCHSELFTPCHSEGALRLLLSVNSATEESHAAQVFQLRVTK